MLRPSSALAIVLFATSSFAAGERRSFKCPADASVYAVWQKYLQCQDAQKQPVRLVLGSIRGGRQPLYSNTEAMHDFYAKLTKAVPHDDAIECHYEVDPMYTADYRAPDYMRAHPCNEKCPSETSMVFHWPRTLKSETDDFQVQGSTERRARPPLSEMFYSCWYAPPDRWSSFGAVYTYRYPKAEKWCFAASKNEVVCRQGQDPNRP